MDKQKQIEEMAKDIVRMAGLGVYEKAEYLYDAGYRKIPENVVVLTREELEEEKRKTAYWKERAELAKTAMYNLRQDTVNKIADWLDNEKGYCGLGYLVKEEFGVKARKYITEDLIEQTRKETAEKFAERLKGEEYLLYGATKEIKICNIRHELIDEICKELGESDESNLRNSTRYRTKC